MIAFAKYFSSIIENGKRIIKSKGIGGSAMTTKEVSPFGFDSQPLEGWTAIYVETTNKEDAVVIGYINKNQVVEAGESRMYALGSTGEVVAYIWSKKDGITGINGFEHSAVRFGPMVQASNAQNVLIQAELQKIAFSISLLGGSYTPGSTDADFSAAESTTVKIK